ncbi:hypothetical protein Tco_1554073 [Tanacetum coccineum]
MELCAGNKPNNGTSHEVSVSTEGVEEWKRIVRTMGEKKKPPYILRQKPGSMHILSVIQDALIVDKSSWTSDAISQPSLATQNLSKDLCFISHGDQHVSIGFLILRSLILKRTSGCTLCIHSEDGILLEPNIKTSSWQYVFLTESCSEHEGVEGTQDRQGCIYKDSKDKDLEISVVKSNQAKDHDIRILFKEYSSYRQDSQITSMQLILQRNSQDYRGSKTQNVTEGSTMNDHTLGGIVSRVFIKVMVIKYSRALYKAIRPVLGNLG